MRWTAAAVGISFFNMLFLLIALGVPWYYRPDVYDDAGYLVTMECNASLLFCSVRNSGFARTAGDPAAAFMLIGLFLHFVTVFAVYTQWAGRSSRLPHSPLALSVFFGVTAFSLFLSFTIYAGEVNKASERPSGTWGGGFGLTIFVFLIEVISAVVVWVRRSEVQDAGSMPASTATTGDNFETPIPRSDAAAYTESTINPARLRFNEVSAKWRKAKGYTTVVGFAILDILFLIFCLSEPWYAEKIAGQEGYGLINTIWRLNEDLQPALRKAGDPAFAFALFAFFFQIYVLCAVTLRFLGRNDGCSGRIPHSLKACLITSGLSSFCCFLSFVIYAGVYNKHRPNTAGQYGGGFGLIIWDWLLTVAVALILYFKRSEVDNAPSAEVGHGAGAPELPNLPTGPASYSDAPAHYEPQAPASAKYPGEEMSADTTVY